MPQPGCTVIKVGGSLFDLPDLAARLRILLKSVDTEQIVLFPGGGAGADAVREMDRIYGLGEEASHWLALRALSVNAYFLKTLLPEFVAVENRRAYAAPLAIVDPFAFAQADDADPDHLPHSWEVTSDSLAARGAILLEAQELILVKSVGMTERMTWPEAAAAGLVDKHFPTIMARAHFHARVVNGQSLV